MAIRCPECHTSNYIEVWPGEYVCLTCGEHFSDSDLRRYMPMIGTANKLLVKRKTRNLPQLFKYVPKLLALSKSSGRLLSKEAPALLKLINLF